MRERILIAGAAGNVGQHVVPLLRAEFALRLLDAKPLPAEGADEVVQADIRDFEAMARLYSDRYGRSLICLRIGWFMPPDSPNLRLNPAVRRIWCSPHDLAHLITRSIHATVLTMLGVEQARLLLA